MTMAVIYTMALTTLDVKATISWSRPVDSLKKSNLDNTWYRDMQLQYPSWPHHGDYAEMAEAGGRGGSCSDFDSVFDRVLKLVFMEFSHIVGIEFIFLQICDWRLYFISRFFAIRVTKLVKSFWLFRAIGLKRVLVYWHLTWQNQWV